MKTFLGKDGRDVIAKRRGRDIAIWHGSTKTQAVLSVVLGPKGKTAEHDEQQVGLLADKVAELCGPSAEILPTLRQLAER